jgi:hypothetical protein
MAILTKSNKKLIVYFPRISRVKVMVNRQRLVLRLTMSTLPVVTLHDRQAFALPAGISKFFGVCHGKTKNPIQFVVETPAEATGRTRKGWGKIGLTWLQV